MVGKSNLWLVEATLIATLKNKEKHPRPESSSTSTRHKFFHRVPMCSNGINCSIYSVESVCS